MKKIFILTMAVLWTLMSACSASTLENVEKELEDTISNAANADKNMSEKTTDIDEPSNGGSSSSSDETDADKSTGIGISGVMSKDEAQDMVGKWVDEHRLGDCQTQEAKYIEDTSDGMYKYNIICNGGPSEYFVYVNPENGSMGVEDYGCYYDSIEYWYRTIWLEQELEIQYDRAGNELYYALISYGNLLRYEDHYIGETVAVKYFNISQILKMNDGIYIAGHEASYDEYLNGWIPDYDKKYIIDVTDIDTKLLKGDVVDIYGRFSGLKTMTSAVGGVEDDYPLITADIVLFEDAVD